MNLGRRPLSNWLAIVVIALSFASISPAGADGQVDGWQPFFAPVASRLDVTKSKNVFLGSGLEGEVYAIATPNGHVVSQKTYASDADATSALKALLQLQEIEAAGLLGPFKVIKVLKKHINVLDLEFIEGQSLNALIRSKANDPRVRRLYASYLVGLKRVTRNIANRMGPVRPILDFDSYSKSCESSLSGVIVYDGTSSAPRQQYGRGVEDYFYDEEILFGIDPSNVVVDRWTGDFFIIDPF